MFVRLAVLIHCQFFGRNVSVKKIMIYFLIPICCNKKMLHIILNLHFSSLNYLSMASWSDKMATFQVWDTCIDLPSSSGFKDCHIIVKICIVPLSFSRLMISVFSTALSSTPKTRISLNIYFFFI